METCLSSFQITVPHGSHCEGCLVGGGRYLSFTEQVPAGLGGVSGKALAFNKATHLEPSFHGGTNHPLFYGLLQLLLVGFAFWFYFSFFLFNRPQEGEIAPAQPITDLSLVFSGKRALGCQLLQTYLCKQIIANVSGVLGAPMWHPDSGPDSCFAWPSHVDLEPDYTPLRAGLYLLSSSSVQILVQYLFLHS